MCADRQHRKMTHQLARRPLGTISNFITRDVLHLPPSSLVFRYSNVLLMFLLSGLWHVLFEILDENGLRMPGVSGIMTYYIVCALGILFEDAVQAVWRSVSGGGARTKDQGVRLWQKIVGYVWVATFFTLFGPIFAAPMVRVSIAKAQFLPLNIVAHIGMPMVGGLLLVGAAILLVGFGGEP